MQISTVLLIFAIWLLLSGVGAVFVGGMLRRRAERTAEISDRGGMDNEEQAPDSDADGGIW